MSGGAEEKEGETPESQDPKPHVYNNLVDHALSVLFAATGACHTDDHWTLKVSNYFFPSNNCGCCFFWRGVFLGNIIGIVLGLLAVQGLRLIF